MLHNEEMPIFLLICITLIKEKKKEQPEIVLVIKEHKCIVMQARYFI